MSTERTHNTWLNGKPFVVTQETVQAFKNVKKPFDCKLCGRTLTAFDNARWIFANGTKGCGTGNFFVCQGCDDENPVVIQRAMADFRTAVELSKRWGIYGPDWAR